MGDQTCPDCGAPLSPVSYSRCAACAAASSATADPTWSTVHGRRDLVQRATTDMTEPRINLVDVFKGFGRYRSPRLVNLTKPSLTPRAVRKAKRKAAREARRKNRSKR